MRRPIHIQLLVPMLSVVVLAIVLRWLRGRRLVTARCGSGSRRKKACGASSPLLAEFPLPAHQGGLATNERALGGRVCVLGLRSKCS